LGVVVDNRHLSELSDLSNVDKIYFAKKQYAGGILEAMDHYRFFTGEPERKAS
jgi:sucrose-phosphate synthase